MTAAVVALALAGCNTPGPTAGSGPAQPPFGTAPASFGAPPAPFGTTSPPFGTTSQPFGSRANAAMARPAPIQHSSQSQKVTVSADGRTVRTDTTRTNVSFDPDQAAVAAASLFGGGGGGGSAHGGIPGVWQAQSSSNRSRCSVQLFGAPDASSGAADSTGCDYGGALHGITGWTYANGQMQIRKGAETSITLNQLGPNRFDGKLTWGILTTTIALYR